MGKTYFSLSDNLNFNGKAIKIKANSTETPTKEGRILMLILKLKYISQYWRLNRRWVCQKTIAAFRRKQTTDS